LVGEKNMNIQKNHWEELYSSGDYKLKKPESLILKSEPIMEKKKIKKILDLGCGSGRHMVYFGKKGYDVVGLDLSSVALKQAKSWLKDEKIENYELIEDDMTNLPLSDNDFDAVISINVIHHNTLLEIEKTIKEIRRVLKDGGLFVATILSKRDYKFGKGKKLEEDTYQKEEGNVIAIHHFFDEDGIKKVFSGFRVISLVEKEKVQSKANKELAHAKLFGCDKVTNIHWEIIAEKL
jgi:ubiquinone/menaquinone biosynthesis C-methylase UbiE